MKKKRGIAIVVFILVLVGGEIYLRKAPRLCDTVLIQSDPDFEYIAQPNQNRYRFKKHIRYNEYSQRSESVVTS